MADKAWKAAEREIARRFGGVRVPITGRARGATPDILHPRYALEIKCRKALPYLLTQAMDQAIAAVRGTQRPVVVVHQTGTRYDSDLVVLRLADFLTITESLS